MDGGFSVQIDELDAPEWSGLLCQFDDASIYQTWSYGAVRWGRTQLSHVVLKRNGQAVAMAQVRVLKLPAMRTGIAYVRWGPLCRLRGAPFDAAAFQQITQALKHEYVGRRGLLLRVIPPAFESDPFGPEVKINLAAIGMMQPSPSLPYHTLRVRLDQPVAELRKKLDQKWRNCLNSAERNGLQVVQAPTLELYDKFLSAYREMRARKPFETTVDVAEFRKMQAELPPPLKLETFICEQEGKLLNAIVVSAVGDSAIYLLGATSGDGLKMKGAYLLQWHAIQWLRARGCRWYDLGGINAERNPGVYHFKSGLSGEDAHQLGTFELSGNWTGALVVRAAEQAQVLVGKVRAKFRKTSPV
jgi:lipid II:glycine glycyltransferase (peptidoglycan interpeptide bridge formation enzyme)